MTSFWFLNSAVKEVLVRGEKNPILLNKYLGFLIKTLENPIPIMVLICKLSTKITSLSVIVYIAMLDIIFKWIAQRLTFDENEAEELCITALNTDQGPSKWWIAP